jgi:hypothetical protein
VYQYGVGAGHAQDGGLGHPTMNCVSCGQYMDGYPLCPADISTILYSSGSSVSVRILGRACVEADLLPTPVSFLCCVEVERDNLIYTRHHQIYLDIN